jgi:hypothetical protein
MRSGLTRRLAGVAACAAISGAALVGVADAKTTHKTAPHPGAACSRAGRKVTYKKGHLVCRKNTKHHLVWVVTK